MSYIAIRHNIFAKMVVLLEPGENRHCGNTRLFFDMIDRRYNKEGAYNIVFTSNKTPSQWKNNFDEDDALLCSLDRVFDNAIVVNIRGESFRGKGLENIAITAGAGVTVPLSGA